MIALEDLVIRIANDLQVLIDKSFMNRSGDRVKDNVRPSDHEKCLQSFQLFRIFSKQVELKSFILPAFQVFYNRSNWRLNAGCSFVVKRIVISDR